MQFDIAQDKLSCEQQEQLAENLTLLRYAKSFTGFGIEITGHTDDVWQGRRDEACSGRSVKKSEVAIGLVNALNDNETARRANRRVELLIKGVDLSLFAKVSTKGD